MSNLYTGIHRIQDPVQRERCARRLLAMRRTLAPLRAKRSDSTLLLATWNIRDFGAGRLNPSPRLPESFFYLAEIVSCFDLVALQEVNRKLEDFDRLVAILGPTWDYILTDATEGTAGNGERMAFLFRRDKVRFGKIAGEIVLPQGQTIVAEDAVKPPERAEPDAGGSGSGSGLQFARTPFLVAFQAGWFRFNLCTVHIYYGTENGAGLRRRIAEIKALVSFFAKRQDAENKGLARLQSAQNYILLGDFNVVSPQHETMAALLEKGFTVPEQIDAAHLPRPRPLLRSDRGAGEGPPIRDDRRRRRGCLYRRVHRRRRRAVPFRDPRQRDRRQPAGSLRALAHLADVRPSAVVGADSDRLHRQLPRRHHRLTGPWPGTD